MDDVGDKFSTIAVDLRGHGDSPRGGEVDFTATSLVADIHRTLEDENIPFPVVLVGNR